MIKVVFAPEVEEDLYELIEILVEKEYLGTYALNDMAKNCNMSLIKEMRTQRGMFFSLL